MIETLNGQRRRLFPTTPNTQTYYPASGHELALARMLQGVADGEGYLLLTGEPGTGKTLLCHALVERLGSDTVCAFLTNSHFPDRAALLQAILYEFSLPHEQKPEQELRLSLTDFLLNNYAKHHRTLLIVDEAQNLSADLLEELRLLGNLEAQGGKALQIIMVGQSSLLENLADPACASLRQRLATRSTLEGLRQEEAVDYVLHHVRLAASRPDAFFTDESLALLANGSRGVPRQLNQIAHRAILLAHEAGSMPVDAEATLEALAQLGLELPEIAQCDGQADSSLNETVSMIGLNQEEMEQPDTDNPVEQQAWSARLNRFSVMS